MHKNILVSFFTLIIGITIACLSNIQPIDGRTTNLDRNDLDRNDLDLDSLEKHLEEEQGPDYWPIPLKNMRQIRVTSLRKLSSEMKIEADQYFETLLNELTVSKNYWFALFPENLDKKKILKKELLSQRGIWVECDWVNKMPPPFDHVDPCTEPELQYMLNNSE